MSETLQPVSLEEIEKSKARGEVSKWNVGPDGEMLAEGFTMNDLGEVVWVGEGPEPADTTAKIEEGEEETVVETPEEVTTTPDPLRKIFDYAADEKRKWYRGSYEEFKEDYSTLEKQLKLYDILKKKKLYRLSKGEFLNQYFPIPEETTESGSQSIAPKDLLKTLKSYDASLTTAEGLQDLLGFFQDEKGHDTLKKELIKHINKEVGTSIGAKHLDKMIRDLVETMGASGVDEEQI